MVPEAAGTSTQNNDFQNTKSSITPEAMSDVTVRLAD
jgi:hypothetical protein